MRSGSISWNIFEYGLRSNSLALSLSSLKGLPCCYSPWERSWGSSSGGSSSPSATLSERSSRAPSLFPATPRAKRRTPAIYQTKSTFATVIPFFRTWSCTKKANWDTSGWLEEREKNILFVLTSISSFVMTRATRTRSKQGGHHLPNSPTLPLGCLCFYHVLVSFGSIPTPKNRESIVFGFLARESWNRINALLHIKNQFYSNESWLTIRIGSFGN